MKILVNESTQHIIFLKIRKELTQGGTLELSDEESKDPEVQNYFNLKMVSFKGAEAPKTVVEPVKEKTPTQPMAPVPEVKKEEPKVEVKKEEPKPAPAPAPAPAFSDTKKK